MAFYVYILASKRNGTIYVGMTDNLVKRMWQHRDDIIPGFTQRYDVKTLVWYEQHESLVRAARVARVGFHARASDQEMEQGLEVGAD